MTAPSDYRFDTLQDHVGHDFGASNPTLLDQPRIDQFAHCTGDHQWIHVDVPRAQSQSPLGSTIVHGMLLLSLIPKAQFDLGVYPSDASGVLNYGFDRVRFLAPVTAGSEIVVRVSMHSVDVKGPGRALVRCINTAFKAGAPEHVVMVADSLGMVMA